MERINPKHFIWIGLALLLIGVLLPLLMVVQLVEATFFLVFFSHAASVVGAFMGFYGIAMGYISRKNHRE
ncbi:MAG TPA: hypothetical protein PKG95_02825 [Anaerolineaceae bacterium]|jgi:hypothetical protein|nr:hypothetical protein [Anaerolineaceae bacterium]